MNPGITMEEKDNTELVVDKILITTVRTYLIIGRIETKQVIFALLLVIHREKHSDG